MENKPALLNSWKEISSYVGRGVRTVQRWERDFGLPVRRPAGHLKSSVIAMTADIDRWLASRRARPQYEQPVLHRAKGIAIVTTADARLRANLEVLKTNMEKLQRERQRLLNTGEEMQQLRRKVKARQSDNGAR
jgi:hypothetical protein